MEDKYLSKIEIPIELTEEHKKAMRKEADMRLCENLMEILSEGNPVLVTLTTQTKQKYSPFGPMEEYSARLSFELPKIETEWLRLIPEQVPEPKWHEKLKKKMRKLLGVIR